MRLLAKLYVEKENQEKFLDLAKNLINATKQEEGNISYDLVVDMKDDTCFTFMENWKDQASLSLHENSAHYKEYLPKMVDLCYKETVIETYKEI